jgi:hypothetical protein
VTIIHSTHRDEVESPFVDWLQEAYDLPDTLHARDVKGSTRPNAKVVRKRTDHHSR